MRPNSYTPRISIITGIVNRGDAISETVVADLEAFDRIAQEERRNLDVQVFCLESSLQDTRVRAVDSWKEIVLDEHFRTSDVYYFHYGIFNQAHNAMRFMRRDARAASFFHNVTQPQFCPPSAEPLIQASYAQIDNLRTSDQIFAASFYSAEQLASYGLGVPTSVVPLFGPNAILQPIEKDDPATDTRPLRFLFCGRFAQSKGLEHFLNALLLAAPDLPRKVEVVLAGTTSLSDNDYLASLKLLAEDMPEGIEVAFVLNQDKAAIQGLFLETDLFVLPSLHEGFGMPVAEALIAGTPVLCSNAGALPEVADGHALTFPAGEVTKLRDALVAFSIALVSGEILCDRGPMPRAAWEKASSGYAATYQRSAYITRITPHFRALLAPTESWRKITRDPLKELSPAEQDGFSETRRFDCAIAGALTGARFTQRLANTDRRLRALLEWAFGAPAPESEMGVWHERYARLGEEAFLAYVSNRPAARQNSKILQASIFARATAAASHLSLQQAEEAKREHAFKQEIIEKELQFLSADTSQSTLDYVNSVYRIVLGRGADPDGLAHYVSLLQSGKADRTRVLLDLQASPEARIAPYRSASQCRFDWVERACER